MVVPPLLPVHDGVRLGVSPAREHRAVLEGLPPWREDRWPTQRFPHVRCQQHMGAGVRLRSPGGARRAGKPRACLMVQRPVAPTLPPRYACVIRVVLAASDKPSPPTVRRRMNQ